MVIAPKGGILGVIRKHPTASLFSGLAVAFVLLGTGSVFAGVALLISVIGIGAGAATDGQVLVFHDLLGLGEGRVAKFVERYADGRAMLEDGARRWSDDVRAGRFPSAAHTYAIAPEELAIVSERLGRE